MWRSAKSKSTEKTEKQRGEVVKSKGGLGGEDYVQSELAKRGVKWQSSDRTKSGVKNELAKRCGKGLNVKLNSTVKVGGKSVWAILAPPIALKWMGKKVSQRQLNKCFGKAKAQSKGAKQNCKAKV